MRYQQVSETKLLLFFFSITNLADVWILSLFLEATELINIFQQFNNIVCWPFGYKTYFQNMKAIQLTFITCGPELVGFQNMKANQSRSTCYKVNSFCIVKHTLEVHNDLSIIYKLEVYSTCGRCICKHDWEIYHGSVICWALSLDKAKPQTAYFPLCVQSQKWFSGWHSPWLIHRKFPDVVTVLWQGSDDVVTILLPTSGTEEDYKTMYLCHLDSYTVTICYWEPSRCPCSNRVVAY